MMMMSCSNEWNWR